MAALLFQFADTDVYEFIIAGFLQASGVFLALSLAFFFFEQRTHRRQKNVDTAIENSARLLRGYAILGVIRAINSIYDIHLKYSLDPSTIENTYREARTRALITHTIESGGDPDDPLDNERNYHHLLWIFQELERLAEMLRSTRQILGPALMEYEDLNRTMQNLESRISEEGQNWKEFGQREPSREKRFSDWERTEKEFPGRSKKPPYANALPREALFNLQSLSRQVVHLVDLLEAPGFKGDREWRERQKLAPGAFIRSDQWGAWR